MYSYPNNYGLGSGYGRGAAVAPAWAPGDEPGLIRDFFPHTQALANDDPYIAITDFSPEGVDATQGTAGFRAICKTNVINGLSTAYFNEDDFYSVGDLSALTAGHGFIIAKLDADLPVAGDGLWFFGTGAAGRYPFSDNNIYEQWGSNTRYSFARGLNLLNEWRVYSIHSAPNDWTAKIDGVEKSHQVVNTVAFSNTCLLGDGGAGNFLKGHILRKFMYDHTLDAEVEANALAYCAGLIAP